MRRVLRTTAFRFENLEESQERGYFLNPRSGLSRFPAETYPIQNVRDVKLKVMRLSEKLPSNPIDPPVYLLMI